MSEANFEYDVCFSFAGEDREYVEGVAGHLIALGVKVFYDRYEQTALWGKDLYVHLDDIYRKKARYCVVFISEHYAKKLWTNHERRSAQARAFEQHREYILPARFDETDVPGILPTVGFISLKSLSPKAFSQLVKTKLDGRTLVQAATKAQEDMRRIYYEGFDCGDLSPKEIKRKLGGLWLVGKKGHWQGSVANGHYRLSNLKGPDASLQNIIRYYEPDQQLVDLGDCRVSVRVRVQPPHDSHSGAGILFRAADDKSAYYAFLLHPGNSVSLGIYLAGQLSFLCSQEIPEIPPDSFSTLKVIGRGPTVTLSVNDNIVHTLADAKLRSGNTGTMALSIGHYVFDDFSIYFRTLTAK